MPSFRVVTGFPDRVTNACERYNPWLLAGFTLLYFAGACALASVKLFWYDELFTVYLSRLPHFSDLWTALAAGTDLNPPLGYLATRFSTVLLGENLLATRLPAAVGFWLMGLSLYRFVARRCGRLYGWVAMLLPFASAIYPCACEARPYALVLGACGLALVCWQEAAEGSRRRLGAIGLAASLTAAVYCHYYAVLVLAPLALGELVRTMGPKRWDPAIWIALGVPVVALGVLLPLIDEARSYAATFWAKPGWHELSFTYGFLLAYLKVPGLMALGVLVVYPHWPFMPGSPAREVRRQGPPVHEIVTVLSLAALPILGILLGQTVTGVYMFRYVFPAILGISILVAFTAHWRTAGCAVVGSLLAALLLARYAEGEVRNYKRLARRSADLLATCQFLNRDQDGVLPLVISDAQLFLQMEQYAPPELAARLVYLSDAEASVRYLGQDTAERALGRLCSCRPLNVVDYRRFLGRQERFLLYDTIGWVKPALEQDGARIEQQAHFKKKPLFLVELEIHRPAR